MKKLYIILIACLSCNHPEHKHNMNCVHWRVLYRPSGRIQDSISYINDSTVAHGIHKHFGTHGKEMTTIQYNHGKREGKEVGYDSLGNIGFISTYVNDVETGYTIWFYTNGRIKTIDSFYNDLKVGKGYVLDSFGNILKYGNIENTSLLYLKSDSIVKLRIGR